MVNTFCQVGGSIGTGILVVIQAFFSRNPQFLGARAFFASIIIVGLIRFIIALMLKTSQR